ncbi:hypothetical protein C4D60_Mb01t15400 [Musa balbisiana]|uniref:Uncharacterized protein n=1 Tax=Musa balbisiana TaxID=52838 RepID=A0A4S8JPH2_MUSBA|nr:hypothetical protein C4D60_Mb01t15400 [Musa balbisiana]
MWPSSHVRQEDLKGCHGRMKIHQLKREGRWMYGFAYRCVNELERVDGDSGQMRSIGDIAANKESHREYLEVTFQEETLNKVTRTVSMVADDDTTRGHRWHLWMKREITRYESRFTFASTPIQMQSGKRAAHCIGIDAIAE